MVAYIIIIILLLGFINNNNTPDDLKASKVRLSFRNEGSPKIKVLDEYTDRK